MTLMDNFILKTDSYKVGHSVQYPPGTTNVYSYFESRGGEFPSTVFFGLQYILEKHFTKIYRKDVYAAQEIFRQHFGSDKLFNIEGWMKLAALDQWDRKGGYLPLRIKAVPEGTVVPTGNVLMTVENTNPEFPWLTNYAETLLSQVWYPTTVATLSFHTKQAILRFLEKTGTPEAIDFKLHDFGFRGASSFETAALGGAAHLVNFKGTDTVPALIVASETYGEAMAGFSVPASEHSTMTSWGRENEIEAYRNMIEKYGDQPFYSVVSDSYDIFAATRDLWGDKLKTEVLAAKGTLVVRPDSGNPPEVVLELLKILGKQFGAEKNDKNYLVLNPKVRLIWGDGLDYKMIETILYRMMIHGWSADNIVFGMGGGLLQKVNRDTQKFAFKCSSAVVSGQEIDVYKQPKTDNGKRSKKGRLALVQTDEGLKTVSESDAGGSDLLETVWENGSFVKTQTLADIRSRAVAKAVARV